MHFLSFHDFLLHNKHSKGAQVYQIFEIRYVSHEISPFSTTTTQIFWANCNISTRSLTELNLHVHTYIMNVEPNPQCTVKYHVHPM